MSIQAVAWVLDHSQSRGIARLVLISLANHHNGGTGQCNPGYRRIAQEAGIARGTVAGAISRLVDLGELEIQEAGTSHRSARYLLPFVQQMDVVRGSTSTSKEKYVHPEANKASTPEVDRSRKSLKEEPLAPAKRTRERDLLFEAVCQSCGIDWSELNTLSRGPINRAVKALRESGATPSDVAVRVGALRLKFPQAAITAPSLAKHWASLGNGRTPDIPEDTERQERERVEFNELARREGWI